MFFAHQIMTYIWYMCVCELNCTLLK